MENETEMGLNRTGLQLSPGDAKEMLENTTLTKPPAGDEWALAALRSAYIQDAEPLGTVPVPGSAKGLAKTAVKALAGKRPEVYMDRLGERLAFERTGTRLYQALIMKCEAPHGGPDTIDLAELQRFCKEEAQHFQLVADCIDALGGDSTAQTPCADVAGVEAMGLLQVVSDPKTSINQSLHAILVAELSDNAGWEELIVLAKDMGQDEAAARFQQALEHERDHLKHVREWHEQATLRESRLLQTA